MTKNILFRADSSSTIGTGHIMRDLVLAEQYSDANIIFVTQELAGNINHKIKEAGYKIEIVKSNDIKEVDNIIKKYKIDMIVIDHYDINYKYEKKLSITNPTLKIMTLDDTYEKHHCDILLNHNIYANKNIYKDLVPKDCELRCGAEYTLLRNEFIKAKNKREKKVNNPNKTIFIAIGGTDHSNINVKILEVLKNFYNVKVSIVTTTSNKHLEELKMYASDKENVKLHINTTQIAKIMSEADFAIITPSVTLNEIMYMKVPFIAIQTDYSQKYMYEYLIENNYLALEKFNVLGLEKHIREFR